MNDFLANRPGTLYSHSGKFSKAVFLMVPIMLALVVAVAFVYIFVMEWLQERIPLLKLLAYFLYCFALYMISGVLSHMGKSRNLIVSMLFALLTAISGICISWIVYLHELSVLDLGEIYKNGFGETPERYLWSIHDLVSKGINTYFGFLPTGIYLYGLWAIEAAGIVFITVYFSRFLFSTSVFCERCNEWAANSEFLLAFTTSNTSGIENLFKNQSLLLEHEIKILPEKPDTQILYYYIEYENCSGCKQMFTVSLRKVDKGIETTIFEDLVVSETFWKFLEQLPSKTLA